MAQLTLHIGTTKTGTTYFQKLIHANTDQLSKIGIGYPDFCATAIHREVGLASMSMVTPAHRELGITSADELAQYRVVMAKNLAHLARSCPISIMSSESLSLDLREDSIARLRGLVEAAFDSVEIVLFVRRQDYLAASVYSQSVKGGFKFGQGPEFFGVRGDRFSLSDLVARWNDGFGRDRVHVFPFLERFKYDKLSVTSRIFALSGQPDIGLLDIDSWRMPAGLTNSSLSGRATEMLRIVNPYAPKSVDGIRNADRDILLRSARDRFPSGTLEPTPQCLAILNEKYIPTNEALRDLVSWTPEWDEWMAQPPARTSEPDLPSAEDVAKFMTDMSAPAGPVKWIVDEAQPPAKLGLAQRVKARLRRARRE